MSTQIAALFTPGIDKHFYLKIKRCPSMIDKLFDMDTMNGRFRMDQGWQTYDPPEITNPMEPYHHGEIRESFSKGWLPIKRTLGDAISEEDWDDDEYGVLHRVIPGRAGAMGEIFMEKREWDAANFLAVTAYSTASPVPGSPDGVSYFSASHPTSLYNAATQSNVSSAPVQLSHTAYYAGYAAMQSQKAPNNYTLMCSKPSKLLYNPVNRAVAVQIARGDWERATNNFNMNAAKMDNLELIEWPHYQKTLSTSAAGSYDGWAIFGEGNELTFMDRQKFRAKSDYDLNVGAYVFVCSVRYDIGARDWRNSYSSAN